MPEGGFDASARTPAPPFYHVKRLQRLGLKVTVEAVADAA